MKDIRQQWKALAAERKIKSEDIAALCIYRALVKNEGKEGAIARLRKSFNPVTNTIKIQNGAAPYYALSVSLWRVKHSSLFSWLSDEEKETLVAISRDIKVRTGDIQ